MCLIKGAVLAGLADEWEMEVQVWNQRCLSSLSLL